MDQGEEYKQKVRSWDLNSLHDALNNIDKGKFPERYLLVLEEISRKVFISNPSSMVNLQKSMLEKYQTGALRVSAKIIDCLILSVIILPVYCIVFVTHHDKFKPIIISCNLLITLAYTILLTKIDRATPGKRMMGIKVLKSPNEDCITLFQSFIREFPGVILFIYFVIGVIAIHFYNNHEVLMIVGIIYLTICAVLGCFCIADFIVFLKDPKRRSLHDKIAKTIVVRTG